MRRKINSFVVVLFLLLLVASFVAFILSRQTSGGTVEIVLTEDGYVPEEVTINEGDTVVFSTTRDAHYWPASNIHPTHEIYSDFDPKEPIAPENTWSFTFNQKGEWKFHDHLAPYFTGVVTVN